LDKIDFSNPDVVNHLLNAYIPAIYNPFSRQIDNAASDRSLSEKIKRLFVPGAMYTSVDDIPERSRFFEEKYYKATEKIEVSYNRYKQLSKDYPDNKAYKEEYLKKNPELQLYYLKSSVERIKDMNGDLRKMSEDKQKAFEERINIDKQILIDKYEEAMKKIKEGVPVIEKSGGR
jgi:hypothetical protein